MASGISRTARVAIEMARARAPELAAQWRDSAGYRALVATFAGVAHDAERACARAERLLADDGWIGPLLAPLLAALDADPFFEPPFRVNRDALRIGAVLFDCPAATLTATVLDADARAAQAPADTVRLSGHWSVTRYVRGGGATLRRWRVAPVAGDFSAASAAPAVARDPVPIADGDVVRQDGRVEGHWIDGACADVVMLSVAIRPGAAPLMREYRLSDGGFVRAAAADDRASRTEMLLAFLRLSGRADAGARFDAASRDADFHLRWAAMREWLLLDARAALPRLADMASDDPNAEVRAAAARTFAAVRCPA
jgi:hypothetical protein